MRPQLVTDCPAGIEQVGIDESTIDDLVLCKAVVMEALRLFTPVPTTARTQQRDILLVGGFRVDAGTQVVITLWMIQRTELNFPRPSEFLPERWATRRGDQWVRKLRRPMTMPPRYQREILGPSWHFLAEAEAAQAGGLRYKKLS